MSKCQCTSTLHNHAPGSCPNEAKQTGGEKCDKCIEKDIAIFGDELPEGQLGPPDQTPTRS